MIQEDHLYIATTNKDDSGLIAKLKLITNMKICIVKYEK